MNGIDYVYRAIGRWLGRQKCGKSGQGILEYVLILALVAVGMSVAVKGTESNLASGLHNSVTSIGGAQFISPPDVAAIQVPTYTPTTAPTSVPTATVTSTAVPATSTPLPPSATSTPIPPTATKTSTPAPPATATPISGPFTTSPATVTLPVSGGSSLWITVTNVSNTTQHMAATPQFGGHFNTVDGSPPCNNNALAPGASCMVQVQLSGGGATGTYTIPLAKAGGFVCYITVTVT